MIYDIKTSAIPGMPYEIFRERTVYTRFESALNQITQSRPEKMEDFLRQLQSKVDEKMETSPTNRTMETPFGG